MYICAYDAAILPLLYCLFVQFRETQQTTFSRLSFLSVMDHDGRRDDTARGQQRQGRHDDQRQNGELQTEEVGRDSCCVFLVLVSNHRDMIDRSEMLWQSVVTCCPRVNV